MNNNFWRGVFSESDGTPSFSRVATAVIVAFAMGWVTALVRANHQLPEFGGLVLLIGTLYGVNKVSSAVGWKNGGEGPGRDHDREHEHDREGNDAR